jgi:L-2-hydroxyglutarate oxidase LhgO
MVDRVQCCVIGAGVVGLAVARALALSGLEVVILEKGSIIGNGISSRNSEVIHAGIYYERNSLKASLCVEGRKMLYEYCASQNVDHKRIGKLLVATDSSQVTKLKSIAEKAAINGVTDLVYMDKKQIYDIEPEVRAEAALFSPSTGIIDSHGLMTSLLKDAEERNTSLALNTMVQKGNYSQGNGWVIQTKMSNMPSSSTVEDKEYKETFDIHCDMVVNCAGLAASKVALALGCNPKDVPITTFAKGNYFTLSKSLTPFKHLIYPLPSEHGLGVHATLDLNNQIRFGPDVEWINSDHDYTVDPMRCVPFDEAIRQYWPGLPRDSLVPSYAGIRPKINGGDFVIQDSTSHGMPGLINLFGIESPGLTASMAIGKAVRDRIVAK